VGGATNIKIANFYSGGARLQLCWTPAVLTDFFVVSVSTPKKIWEQDSTSTRVRPIPFKSSHFFVHTLFFYLTLWYSLVGVSWNKHHPPKHTDTHKTCLMLFIQLLRQNVVSQITVMFSYSLTLWPWSWTFTV